MIRQAESSSTHENAPQLKKKAKKYYKENREKIRKNYKEYYEKNRKKLKEKRRADLGWRCLGWFSDTERKVWK